MACESKHINKICVNCHQKKKKKKVSNDINRRMISERAEVIIGIHNSSGHVILSGYISCKREDTNSLLFVTESKNTLS